MGLVGGMDPPGGAGFEGKSMTTDPDISEAASNNGKAKRGRPRLMRGFVHEQNRCYAAEAVSILVPDFKNIDPEYAWLISRGPPEVYRTTVLAELGRIGDAKHIREWAEILCEKRPRVKDAVTWVRRWRTGRESLYPGGSRSDLRIALYDFCEEYLRTHAGVDFNDIRGAVDDLAAQLDAL
jgi:hypothetical protein